MPELQGASVLAKLVSGAAILIVVSTPMSYADARGEAKTQVAFGITVAQRGLWREATYRFERAIEIDPSYPAAYNNLAIAYEQSGRVEDARKAYEKALELDSKNALIRQNYDLFREIHDRANRENTR